MTDIHAAISELKALEARATGGPHYVRVSKYASGMVATYDVRSTLGGKSDIGVCECDGEGDAEHIASALNALPQLLAYIENLGAVASAAKAHRESDPDRGGGSHARLGWKLDDAIDALERDE